MKSNCVRSLRCTVDTDAAPPALTQSKRPQRARLRIAAAAVGMLLANGAFAGEVAFQEHVMLTDAWGFPSDNDFIGDVDGDGDPDVVSCTRYSGAVWWFQNSGGSSPTFTTRQIDTHGDCRSVYAADLDGDGHTDLLSASAIGAGEVRWYKNNGAATPSFTKRTIPTTAVDFFSVSAADINGDGRMDILTGAGPSGPSSNQLAWHENKGGNPPTFVEHQISLSPVWPHSVKTVDLNNDGELDLVVGFMDGRAAAWYENDGASTPSFVQHMLPTPAGHGVVKVDVGDINSDGAVDIAVALNDTGGGVAWLKSSGGTTPTFARYTVEASSSMDALAVSLGDVDGDGDLDVLGAPRYFAGGDVYSSDFAWYENRGGATPTFVKHVMSTVPETPNTATFISALDMLPADFNADGKLDILAREDTYDYPARLMWYENRGTGNILFEDHFTSPTLSPEWKSIKPSQYVEDSWLHSLDTNTGRDSFAVVHDGDMTWTDYTFRVKADGLLSMGGEVDDFNLLFRTHGMKYAPLGIDGHYYRLEVGTGGYALWRYDGFASSNTTLFSKPGPFDTSKPINVTITVTGARIQVWFDGKSVIDVIDPAPLLYGGIGVGAVWESEARFDDVVVSGVAGAAAGQAFGLCPGDINSDGIADVAMIAGDGKAKIKNFNGQLVNQFTFSDPSLVSVKLMPDMNGNGAPELVGLAANSHKAELFDTLSGAKLATVSFNTKLNHVDVDVVPDQNGNGVAEVAALGQGSGKVEIKDALTSQLLRSSTFFGEDFKAVDLAVYDNLVGDGSVKFGVLGENNAADVSDKLAVRDLTTGARYRTLQLGQGWTVKQQAVVHDMNANDTQELAVMRVKGSDAVNVTIRDSKTNGVLNSIGLSRIYAPYQLLVIPDINGNAIDEVVVFGKTSTGEQAAQLRDSKTGEQLRSVWFNKNFPAQDVATCGDNNGNGATDIVVLGQRASDGKLRAMVQDSKTGALIKSVDY